MPTAGAVLTPHRPVAADRVRAAATRRRSPLRLVRQAASAPHRALEVARVGVGASRSAFLQNPQSLYDATITPQIQCEAFTIEERLRFEQRYQALLLDLLARHELVLLQDIAKARRWRERERRTS